MSTDKRIKTRNLRESGVQQSAQVKVSGSEVKAPTSLKPESSAVRETEYLLAIPGVRESIEKARAEPLVKSKRKLNWS